MKRILRLLGMTLGILAVIVAPTVIPLPDVGAAFPYLTEIANRIELSALRLIPDEIEEFVAALSERLA